MLTRSEGVPRGLLTVVAGPRLPLLESQLLDLLDLARIATDPSSPSLPPHLVHELRACFTYGTLSHGCCRFHYSAWGPNPMMLFPGTPLACIIQARRRPLLLPKSIAMSIASASRWGRMGLAT